MSETTACSFVLTSLPMTTAMTSSMKFRDSSFFSENSTSRSRVEISSSFFAVSSTDAWLFPRFKMMAYARFNRPDIRAKKPFDASLARFWAYM
jgi:hypothetical protein